jgi:hypothetical protein
MGGPGRARRRGWARGVLPLAHWGTRQLESRAAPGRRNRSASDERRARRRSAESPRPPIARRLLLVPERASAAPRPRTAASRPLSSSAARATELLGAELVDQPIARRSTSQLDRGSIARAHGADTASSNHRFSVSSTAILPQRSIRIIGSDGHPSRPSSVARGGRPRRPRPTASPA